MHKSSVFIITVIGLCICISLSKSEGEVKKAKVKCKPVYALNCHENCNWGNILDENDCPTCTCCDNPMCATPCMHGYQKDWDTGCLTCVCLHPDEL